MSDITKGTSDVTRYIMIVDSADGSPETGITITDLDIQYTRNREAPATKVDATALSTTSDAHSDNKMIEVDATSSPGLYRVDWPDAAFSVGSEGVILTITGTGFAPAVEDITLINEVIAVAGASINQPVKDEPNGFTITWGENEANDEDVTHALDGITHDIEAANDTTEKIDVYYEFSVGGDGIPTGVSAHHQLEKGGGAGKNITIYAYSWGGATWEQIGSLDSDTVLASDNYSLFSTHVGTGANLGLVRIRYDTGTVAFTTTTKLLVDQILVQYTVVSRTVGYDGGQVFIDTVNGTAGTESFVNGTADNPSLTLADAITIASNIGLPNFFVNPGSSITFAEGHTNEVWVGHGWNLALGGQDVSNTHFFEAVVSGIATTPTGEADFHECRIGTCTLGATHIENCGLTGTITLSAASTYTLSDCYSEVAGSSSPTIDFGTAVGNTSLNMRRYSGGIQIESMGDTGTDTMSLEGKGQFIEGTCTGGTVVIRGHFTLSGITNLTLSDDARFALDQPISNLLMNGTSTGSSTTTKVFVQSGDTPSGGSDDDYNNAIIVVFRGADKSTARMNMRTVTDYDDSDPSFTVDTAFGFTPQSGDLVEIYLTDPEVASSMSKLSSGFGTSSPDRLYDHQRAIMSKVATAPSGVGTYNPATDSLEVLGEGQVAMKGAAFDTGTDSLQAIRDVIDTLLAPSVVSSSALSGSGFLSDCVSLIRKSVDEPSTTPKYTDSDMVELIQGAFDVIIQDISINTDHPMLARMEISVVDGQQEYVLPSHCAGVWRLAKINAVTNVPIWEVWPKGQLSFRGSGFSLEGNVLRLNMDWNQSETLEILYEPNGETTIHKGTAGAIDASTVTFATSPTDGTLDTRESCYVGYMIRILSSDEAIVEERMITAYDNNTGIATVNVDFTETHTGTVVYEVLPQYSRLLKHAVCLRASLDLLANEGNAQKINTLERAYKVKLSALRRAVTRKQARFTAWMDGDTSDNTNRGGPFEGWF